MCGRYATTRSSGDLSGLFESADETGGALVADYNVAPTDPVPLVRVTSEGHRALCLVRWGLVPPWSRSPAGAARMINARAETVATSRAYAPSFARRRALVPADGWYEWVRRPDGTKQPFYMTPRDGSVLAFAGIWSVWGGSDDPLLTCSVVTTAALGELAEVHDRMPLLLPPDRWAAWLGVESEPAELLAPPSPQWLAGLEVRPVGRAVGDVRNDGPELTARVPLPGSPGPGEETLF
ncbi:SOS response-associated peptidase [Micromonospora craniellae]|uniref:Abasic site processing protein n=1 Tax=Micromonospora craniellae TaxID=2294034 RepID=A0A372G565_9ACTN|nr:SOS response-associated peptidase [Micromonospora craniellae]QOC90484.1 SOS response-associated peptidase [Micromonospora craniellae]RFS48128.1 SOS response-associated peptidase [Micromonospora craniellae]